MSWDGLGMQIFLECALFLVPVKKKKYESGKKQKSFKEREDTGARDATVVVKGYFPRGGV